MAEFLSVIAEAPDFATAAQFVCEQLAKFAGASRALLFTLDDDGSALALAACTGYGADDAPALQFTVEHESHPLAYSVLSLTPLLCERGGREVALPFDDCLILPFPQPQQKGSPPIMTEQRLRSAVPTPCRQLPQLTAVEGRRRIGHAPFAAILLEGASLHINADALADAALLAGPVLARTQHMERFRQSAERLDEQRDLLTTIINSLPDPIVITDAATDIVVQNRRAEHLLSTSDLDSEGRRRAVEINNLLFTSYLSRSVIGGPRAQGGARELNLVDPDEGNDLLFEVLAHPLHESSRQGAFVSVLRDVTDLRRAVAELERQVQRGRLAEIDATRERDRLNLILENVADPILVTDDRSNIILMNPQAEELFQFDMHADNHARATAVRGNDTKFTTFISDFTIGLANARREQMRLTQPATGAVLPVEVVSGKIMNARGEPMAIVSVLHDLTKQVENERLYEELKRFSSQLEARIRAATADLGEQNKRLQWSSRELQKANRLKSEFLASMSHELRTPLNAIMGYAALLADRIYGDVNDRQEEGLRRIHVSAQHLLALINDILDLAKIEAGKMPLHLAPVSVALVVAEISQQVEPTVRRKKLTFSTDLPGDLPVMISDETKIKQVLLNLLSNAVKFTNTGGVVVRVRIEGNVVRVDIEDTGIGIRPEDMEAIWEDFRQVDQSRTREFGGTGLGLSITRKLIQALGGSVRVESEYGKGSTFSVALPLQLSPRLASDVLHTEPLPVGESEAESDDAWAGVATRLNLGASEPG
ncbi:MAG TPA: ATP-binding protein [Gemmatimonadaceae bacterium]|nr:ATP-binding protein [Gemmatimonadaceae bacterium]